MKPVVLSANSYWYLYNFRLSSIKQLLKENYSVVCVAPKDEFAEKLSKIGCNLNHLEFDSKSKNPLKDISLFIKFYLIYKKINPLIVFNFTIKNNIYGGFAASFLKIPVISNVSGLGTSFIKSGFLESIVLFLYKISQFRVLYMYFQNSEDKKLFINKKIIAKNKSKLIPGSGVNTDRFHPKLKKKNRKNTSFIFVYIGRFLYDKGLLELIDSFKIISKNKCDCELWLVGSIDKNNNSAIPIDVIEKWKKINGISILNHTDQVELTLSQVDCVVLPSYREGMPRSLLEACSMEIPVVATNVTGCREIITDGLNGFLCNVRDTKSLTNSLIKMKKTPNHIREKMGTNGRKIVNQSYKEEIVINEILKNVKEVSLNN